MCSEIAVKMETFKADHTNHFFFWKHQLPLDLLPFISVGKLPECTLF